MRERFDWHWRPGPGQTACDGASPHQLTSSKSDPCGTHCSPSCSRCTPCHAPGLAALTDLQHLTLSDLDTKQIPAVSTDWFPVPGSIFSQLGRLTHLELDKCVASSTLEHLQQLTNLEHLILGRLAVSVGWGSVEGRGCLWQHWLECLNLGGYTRLHCMPGMPSDNMQACMHRCAMRLAV